MRRVLVLSYYFPPLGGVGAQRPLKFVKYLPEWGYVATVVTGPPDARTEWAPADSSLNAEVPTGTEVLRAEGPPPPVAGTRHRLSRWFGLWSPFQQWWRRESLRLGRSAVADVDVVYTMMSPFSTGVAAASVAGAAGKPWIADLQDPWALDEWTVYPTALHRRLDELQMRRDPRSAAAVITTTREAAQVLVARFPEFADSRVRTIPWGWDRSDFKATPQPRGDDAFRIVYAGYSHVQRGHKHRARQSVRTLLGGAVRGMDVLPRSHVFLLEAIERIGRVDPDLAGRVELHRAVRHRSDGDRHVDRRRPTRERAAREQERQEEREEPAQTPSWALSIACRSRMTMIVPAHGGPPSFVLPGTSIPSARRGFKQAGAAPPAARRQSRRS